MNKTLRKGKFKKYFGSGYYMRWLMTTDLSYAQWLKLQPKWLQNRMLGKARAVIFRAGGDNHENAMLCRGEPIKLMRLRKDLKLWVK